MNKFDRVFAILILLQTKNIIKAKTIAERYDISLRTVYRDMNTLKSAGIPIIGDPGIGYSIMEGYRIPPIMFSQGETAALLTAEKFIGKMADQETQSYYSSALLKIKSILRSSEKHSLDVLDRSIAISDDDNKEYNALLPDLFRGIASKQMMHMEYQKADGTSSSRHIEAIGCYHRANNWYLIAYCQLKKDYRTFKVDRIVAIKVLSDHFKTEHISLQDYIDQQDEQWKEEQKFKSIEIAFSRSYVKFAERRKYYFGFVDQIDDGETIRMKFLNSSIEIIARWLLQFGDQATVIAPVELKERIKLLASDLYKHYH